MQDEITVSPLVDILSKQLGEQVVMSGEGYVLLKGFAKVAQADVDLALVEQTKIYDNDILNKAKKEALQYLADTDWYVVRFAETGVAIPADIATKREECRVLQ